MTEHLRGGGMSGIAANIKNLHGSYKFTGSGALGGKEARLAAAAYLNATKVVCPCAPCPWALRTHTERATLPPVRRLAGTGSKASTVS